MSRKKINTSFPFCSIWLQPGVGSLRTAKVRQCLLSHKCMRAWSSSSPRWPPSSLTMCRGSSWFSFFTLSTFPIGWTEFHLFSSLRRTHSPSLVPWYDMVSKCRVRLHYEDNIWAQGVMGIRPSHTHLYKCLPGWSTHLGIGRGTAHPTARGEASRLCSYLGSSLHTQNRMGGKLEGRKGRGDNQESRQPTRTVALPFPFTFL